MCSKIPVQDVIDSKKEKIFVRRNQFDITATLGYGINVSLVHFTLFLMVLCIVRWPDPELAEKYDADHQGIAIETHDKEHLH